MQEASLFWSELQSPPPLRAPPRDAKMLRGFAAGVYVCMRMRVRARTF